ncbi:MAG: DUF885 domain-containing protein [Acidimicrobiia bacterium]
MTKLPGPEVMFALAILGAACTPSPGATVSTGEPGTTTVAATPSPSTGPSGPESFDEFVENSFQELTRRRPQLVTVLGLDAVYRTRPDQLDDLSPEYTLATTAVAESLLSRLRGYDPETLTSDQRVTYRTFEWHLETAIEAHEFRLLEWPVHFLINSYNEDLISLFMTVHPLTGPVEIESYLARLAAVPAQVDQVISWMEQAEDAGAVPAGYLIDITIRQLDDDISGGDPDRTALLAAFEDRILDTDLEVETASGYVERARSELATSFIPAWQRLIDHLRGIGQRHTSISLADLPGGDSYYRHLLSRHTSTDLSPEEIHQIGLREADRIKTEMYELAVASGLGEMSVAGFRDLAANRGGFVSGEDVVDAYAGIIDNASDWFGPYFNTVPSTPLEIVNDPGTVAFYLVPASDGSRPGQFHAGTGGQQVPRYTMASLAYHEAVPGHHFQIATAQESELASPQRFLTSTGHVEGWALYAERLAAEIGVYAADPLSDFGRLDYELLRAARLIVDTGIHHYRWTRDEAVATMTGVMEGDHLNHEVERYALYPGQATAYMVGMLAILDLRDTNGISIDDPEAMAHFHETFLGQGNVPLAVLPDLSDR